MKEDVSCLTTSGFDVQAAVFLARAAELAYEVDETIISNWAHQRGFAVARGGCD